MDARAHRCRLRLWVHGMLFMTLHWSALSAAESVNHEGRLLTTPTIATPVNWNTAAADTIMANVQIFPTNNAWNEDISGLPVAANSASMITTMGAATSIGYNSDMPFVIVPPGQALVPITYGAYGDESDPGPFPLPLTAPIEGGSSSTGDRHVFSIDPINGYLYELYRGFPQAGSWKCDCSVKWNLKSNATRTAGWTSADASGMSVMAGVARFDECDRGMVEHAIRVTFDRTRTSYVYPATHQAGGSSNTSWPRMGERFRLKASKDISSFPKHARAIALAMKKYGLIVADNGSSWRISNVPDARFSGLTSLTTLKGGDFEVVVGTGATGGPRAAGAGNTCVHAGFTQTITLPAAATLNGTANDPDTATLIYTWSKLSGPGTVTFGNAAQIDTSASFGAAGTYVLQLSARQGVNPASTAAVTIVVNPGSGNQAPVIGSAASASPNPVTGANSTSVAVSATDPDSGPAALVYTWSKVSGPGTVTFSPNGTTGAATGTATFSASGTYSLQVSVNDGAAGATSQITGLVVTLPSAPTITTQPTNKTVTAGQTATFTVTATGTAPLTYQWQKNGGNIAGATGASYTTPTTTTGDSGSTYRVIVTNGSGSVTSSSATLTVTVATNAITAGVSTVTFTAPTGSATPVTTTISLTNSSGSAITVTPSTGTGWLSTGGAVTVPAGGTVTLTITANPAGLSGTVTGSLTLTNSPGGQTQTLPVSLTVSDTTSIGKKKKGCAIGIGGNAELGWEWLVAAVGLGLAATRIQRRHRCA